MRSFKSGIGAIAGLVTLIGSQSIANAANLSEGAEVQHRGGLVFVKPSATLPKPVGKASAFYSIVTPDAAVPTAPKLSPAAKAKVGLPPALGWWGETPASLACLHGLVPASMGCNPNVVTTPSSLGSNAIAIVDAYDNPTAVADLAKYSAQFGLPAPSNANFQVVYATGSRPAYDAGWQVESDLDIEMAHAIAPNAKVYLVEAASDSIGDLLTAVNVASSLVQKASGGTVSMSWGGSEWSSEASLDPNFEKTGVVFVAASGDGYVVGWPAVSPNVVAAGGATIARNASFAYQGFAPWSEEGAGQSAYYPAPSYQKGLGVSMRAVPDAVSVADPATPVWVVNDGEWTAVGGTSVASPILAALINASGHFAASSQAELSNMYNAKATNGASFADSAGGFCGLHAEVGSNEKAYDPCVGVGFPISTKTQ